MSLLSSFWKALLRLPGFDIERAKPEPWARPITNVNDTLNITVEVYIVYTIKSIKMAVFERANISYIMKLKVDIFVSRDLECQDLVLGQTMW